MTTTLMILQAIISVLLIITVLLQFGKGAEAGLMAQAGSESIMSSSTRGNIMTKITAVLAVLFLGNSILLARMQDTKFQKSILDSEAPVARRLNNDSAKKDAVPAATTPAGATEGKKAAEAVKDLAPQATSPAKK